MFNVKKGIQKNRNKLKANVAPGCLFKTQRPELFTAPAL
jgi:hypothetical protein